MNKEINSNVSTYFGLGFHLGMRNWPCPWIIAEDSHIIGWGCALACVQRVLAGISVHISKSARQPIHSQLSQLWWHTLWRVYVKCSKEGTEVPGDSLAIFLHEDRLHKKSFIWRGLPCHLEGHGGQAWGFGWFSATLSANCKCLQTSERPLLRCNFIIFLSLNDRAATLGRGELDHKCPKIRLECLWCAAASYHRSGLEGNRFLKRKNA